MKQIEIETSTYWQQVYLNARCNSGEYHGDKLPVMNWDWPKNGFLTRRRAELAGQEAQDEIRNQKSIFRLCDF